MIVLLWAALLRRMRPSRSVVVALLALAGAFIVYLDWSSDITFEEFVGVSEPSTASAASHPLSAAPVEAVKSQLPCGPKT